MPLKSDISIDVAKFDPASTKEQTKAVHHILGPNSELGWHEVGAVKYREMIKKGETPIPVPVYLPQALDIEIPSRDAGRAIPCRLLYPSARTTPEQRKANRGSLLHFHGGGWESHTRSSSAARVLGEHDDSDAWLQLYADAADMAVISVGYRLAPEHPFPAGPDDAKDAAEYLVENSEDEYGGPLRFLAGESAGGHLSTLVAIHLLRTIPTFSLAGLLLNYGWYDLSGLPSLRNYKKTLILNRDILEAFAAAILPGQPAAKLKDPAVSPLYEDLERFRGRLPPALLTCGTDDPLLDDTVAMGARWQLAGGDAVVKIYPGAAHGFITFPQEMYPEAAAGVADLRTFITERLARV